MIDPTDEMVKLAVKKFVDAPGVTIREIDAAMHDALAAVFAVVERDQAGPCQVELHMLVNGPATVCELRHGHRGDHVSGVTRWRERTSVPINRHTGIGQTVYALIFNGITAASMVTTRLHDGFMPLSERERFAEAVYSELAAGGIEFRLGGLALLAQVAGGGLERDLEELEAVDPDVRAAADRVAEVSDRLLAQARRSTNAKSSGGEG